jgi:hypothetical protein
MNLLKEKLVSEARTKYDEIYPCSHLDSLAECFTVIDNTVFFWFNTKDCSTHMLSAQM